MAAGPGVNPAKKESKMEEKSLGKRILDVPFWYHQVTLPDGTVTPGMFPINVKAYGIPNDFTNKRVLDIGAWDGFWTWEALKRGAAEVVAIDDFSDSLGALAVKREKWETFDLCCEAFGFIDVTSAQDPAGQKTFLNNKNQKCVRIEMSVYDIDKYFNEFDIVFFFGTIYHCKDPYKVMEIVSKICGGEIYVESAICDDYSPYRGGMNRGYPQCDMVMEFYPTDQYGHNEKNWWVPTLQCLGTMVESVGFKNIHAWALTEPPKEVSECRGFVYGSKTGAENENVNKLSIVKTTAKQIKVAAVMSVPRLGFQDNSFSVFEGLMPLGIPLIKVQGALWGQCLERGIQQQIDTGAEAILTIDYDTVFTCEDVRTLVRLMQDNPEADAIVPFQAGRSGMQALLTMKTKSGMVREIIPREEFAPDTTKIATGHFGLTLLRTSSLMKLPHPWLIGQPNQDGQWGPGRIDDDIYFWKLMEKHNMNVLSANRDVLGHLELVITWLDEDLKPFYQPVCEYQKSGKPAKAWK